MANTYFQFKQFTVWQQACAMKVTIDGCLFGAWVAAAIAALPTPPQTVVDVGCGTGLLSLMVAQKALAQIDAVEIEPAAARQAAENIAASPWADRITVLHTDVLLLEEDKLFNCVVANPPFYETDLPSGNAAKNTAHHSRALTLTALIQFIKKRLAKGGQFYLLLPYKRLAEAVQILKTTGLAIHQQTDVSASPAHPPFRTMISGGNYSAACLSNHIFVKAEGQRYSTEAALLLKDYYLAL